MRFPSVPVTAIVPSKTVMKNPVSEFDELCREISSAATVAPANELVEAIFDISAFQRSKSGTKNFKKAQNIKRRDHSKQHISNYKRQKTL